MLLIEGGAEAANMYLAPILLSALNFSQDNGQNNQYVDDIKVGFFLLFIFGSAQHYENKTSHLHR